MEILHQIKSYLDPQYIAGGGLLVLFLVVFAETGLMVGFFLPGDSLLFVAGMLSALGLLPPVLILMGVLVAAAILGDQTGYLFGRRLGPALFRRPESRFFKPAYIERTQAFFAKHGGKTIILGRFVPIVRTFAPIVAGAARLDYKTFVAYNIIGGVVWVVSMCLAGFFLGKIPWVQHNIEFIALGIVLVSLLPVVITFIKERRTARAAAATAAAVVEEGARRGV